MMNRTTEWLNENMQRRYPFMDNYPMLASGIEVPDSLFLDFTAVVYDTAGVTASLVLTQVELATTPELTRLVILYFIDGLGSLFVLGLPESLPVYSEILYVTYNARHSFTFGPGIAELLAKYSDGVYTLDAPVPFIPTLFKSQDRHQVRSITCRNGNFTSTGVVALKEGYNCQIVVSKDNKVIQIGAVSGAGAGKDCSNPVAGAATCVNTLLRINNLHGSDDGTFMIVGGRGLEVVADPDNHTLTVRASKDITDRMCKSL
jgi:hypothetical protein